MEKQMVFLQQKDIATCLDQPCSSLNPVSADNKNFKTTIEKTTSSNISTPSTNYPANLAPDKEYVSEDTDELSEMEYRVLLEALNSS